MVQGMVPCTANYAPLIGRLCSLRRGVFHEVVPIIDESTGNRLHRFLNGAQPKIVRLVDAVCRTGFRGVSRDGPSRLISKFELGRQ